MTYERARALILLALGRGETKTLQGWADLIGVTTPGAVSYHFKALVRKGFIVRPRPGHPELTPAGQEVANLLMALDDGQSVYRRLMQTYFGGYSYQAAATVQTLVDQQDAEYALCRQGLRRRNSAGSKELERKATSQACLDALKQNSTMEDAARQVGIAGAALGARVKLLFERALKGMAVAS